MEKESVRVRVRVTITTPFQSKETEHSQLKLLVHSRTYPLALNINAVVEGLLNVG